MMLACTVADVGGDDHNDDDDNEGRTLVGRLKIATTVIMIIER